MKIYTTRVWRELLHALVDYGQEVSPLSAGAAWRGRKNREMLAMQSMVPMDCPVVVSPARKLGRRFMCAEAAWILSGDNRLATILPYAKSIEKMSDDGVRFFGAYGPKVVDQLSFIVWTLLNDPASRQAVLNVWREQPRPSKDTPCTLSLQFLVRNGKLHCNATMRSSDVVMGWCYDIFNFSMIAAAVAIEVRNLGAEHPVAEWRELFEKLTLGELRLTTGSQHLYETDLEMAAAALAEKATDDVEPLPMDLSEFKSTQDLVEHLWACARNDGTAQKNWLRLWL